MIAVYLGMSVNEIVHAFTAASKLTLSDRATFEDAMSMNAVDVCRRAKRIQRIIGHDTELVL